MINTIGLPNEIQGTYVIERAIGEGGGGIVYLATHTRLQKKVVLKKIRGEIVDFVNCRTEVDVLKNLRHSYLPQVIDFIESSDGIFTVMDYIDGESLQSMLDRGVKLDEKRVQKYAAQLCEAVQYLHSQNPPIIHGDIKPDNVMITRNDDICLIDFNVSGFLNGENLQMMGYTPGYASPEQVKAVTESMEAASSPADSEETVLLGSVPKPNISRHRGGTEIGTQSDIYSIGATIYALVGGNVNNLGGRKIDFLGKVSDGMRIIVAKAVEKTPSKRYKTAGDMLNAINYVQKMDKEYRRLISKQHIKTFLYCLVLAAGIVLIVWGSRRMDKEREDKYESYVAEMLSASEKEPDDMEKLFDKATEIHADRLEPYYYMSYYLYEHGKKDDLAKLIEDIELKKPAGDREMYSKAWYLMADSLFEQDNYDAAMDYYRASIDNDPENASLYRDYAVSLIYGGRLREAGKVLEDAIGKGMTEADIYMVKGELARIQGDYSSASDYFEKVVGATDDEHLKLRAYLGFSKSCLALGDLKSLKQAVKTLENAAKELSMNNRLLIYEDLGATYIKLGDLKDNKEYLEKAAKTYKTIVEMGWANKVTYSNIIVLDQRTKNFEDAKEWAEKMCDRYPDEYISYMRRALVEVEIQNGLKEKQRDFSDFVKFYDKAEQLYKEASNFGSDSEMLLLENTYTQLAAGHWLN